jgi:hypothetical protein
MSLRHSNTIRLTSGSHAHTESVIMATKTIIMQLKQAGKRHSEIKKIKDKVGSLTLNEAREYQELEKIRQEYINSSLLSRELLDDFFK